MSSYAAADILTPPAIEFELQERAAIANMLFTPIQDDTTRVKFLVLGLTEMPSVQNGFGNYSLSLATYLETLV